MTHARLRWNRNLWQNDGSEFAELARRKARKPHLRKSGEKNPWEESWR